MKPFSSIFISILCTLSLQAQTHNWTRTNPGGGGAYSTIGASVSGIIIAGSDLSGAYRSSNGGQTWEVIGASKGLTETHVSGVGFHRTNGNILYIGTENGIFRSDNGGNSVNQVLQGGYITDIEFGTNNGNTGYASYHPAYNSNNGVIYKTTDNGLSWSQISTNLPSGIRILKLVVNPTNANTIYLLSGEGRFACGPADVFRSTDGGVNWSNLTNGLAEILDVAIDSNTPDNVFVTTMNADCSAQYYWTDILGDIYKSTNGGTTWSSPLSAYTGMIWLDVNNANTIRLIDPREPFPWNNRAGTFTSTDGGVTFTQTGDVNNWDTFFQGDIFWCYSSSYNGICKTLGEDLSNNNNLFWINSQWVFKTINNGNTFENIFTDEITSGFWQSRGFDNVNMADVSVSKANPNIIYAAYFDIGIQRSLDKGLSWQSCNTAAYTGGWDGFGGNCATVLADPTRANVVWASLGGEQNGQATTYLLKNTNTGHKDNWILANTGLPDEEIIGLSIDENSPENNRTLYVTALKDVYKSTNDGGSWTQVFNCNGCRFTAVDKFDGNIVYAGGENGLWRSMDGGSNWTNVSHTQMPTNNGAEFWDGDYAGVFDVKTDPNNANWLYVTALGSNKGLFKSTDNGNSWTKILTDDFMRKVAIVPNNSAVLYATSSSAFEAGGYDANSKGVLYSENGGQTWTQQNQGMAYPFALAVDVDNTINPTVFVGSSGTGFQKSLVPGNVMPVEYLDAFSARIVNDKVKLTWSTVTEINADYFEIQRAVDLKNWHQLSKVNAKGKENIVSKYTAIDVAPLNGTSYYRIKQWDVNGKYEYSAVANIHFENLTIQLQPNPSNGEFALLFSKNQEVLITITDIVGQSLFQQKYKGKQANLDVKHLKSGVYLIVVQSNEQLLVEKIIIQ